MSTSLIDLDINEDPSSLKATTSIKPFRAVDHVKDGKTVHGKTHLLLAASGSLATNTLEKVIDELWDYENLSIRIVLSKGAKRHISAATLLKKRFVDAVYTDDDWPQHETQKPNAFLHYELRTWLDVMVVVPCSPTMMATMANGIADDLITSIVQVFDKEGALNPPGRIGRYKYLAIAPAMDSATWDSPAVKQNLNKLHYTWIYERTFQSGIRKRVGWCVVMLNLRGDDKAPPDFNHQEDNCNMQLKEVMSELLWELSKYQKNHEMFAPGA